MIPRLSPNAYLLSGTLLLAGCVSGSPTSDLQTMALQEAAMEQGQMQMAEGATPGAVRPEMAVASVPTPESSPRFAPDADPGLALVAQTESAPAEAAARETLNMINEPAANPAPAPATNTQTANTEKPAIVVPPVSQTKVVTASVQPSTGKQEKSFFDRLFGKRQSKNGAAASSGNKRTVIKPQRAKSDLPGVRGGSTLFGIDESENAKEEELENSNVQVASVGQLGRLTSKHGFILQTSRVQADCFTSDLVKILRVVERRYGKKVTVTSGYRSPESNRRAGGAKKSLHMYCKAADIQVSGVSKWDLAKYLRTMPNRGGVGTYCRTNSVHIDTGTKRDWHHPCRRRSSKSVRKS